MSLPAILRAWRDRLSPAAVGRPLGSARRAAGLRREELSDLAGISVDYLVRLEQGRAKSQSAQVIAALARALQLSRQERYHLYRLAGLQPPPDGAVVDHIPPGMQRVLPWRVVADLRRVAGRDPTDSRLASLIHRTLEGNPRFARLWRDGAVAGHREDRKAIRHPEIGDITVGCDVLSDSDTDLKIVIYTAVPDSEDETKLQLTRVIGPQTAPL